MIAVIKPGQNPTQASNTPGRRMPERFYCISMKSYSNDLHLCSKDHLWTLPVGKYSTH